MAEVPDIELNDGAKIPQLGFGVFQVDPDETEDVVAKALDVGYRHIDTAAAYRKEKGVGAAITASGIPREEIFVTTKLWNSAQGHDSALEAAAKSLERLGLDYVDLYLIHWPVPTDGLFVETWKAFEELRADGKAKSIGVSNFRTQDLDRLADETETVPTVNQIELHPRLPQRGLRAYHDEHGIKTEAWSPLAQGGIFDEPALRALASEHGVSPAQVILRWHIELGNIVIPKSVTAERIESNFDIFGFELSSEQMVDMDALEDAEDGRIGPDPATFKAP